MCGRLRFLHIYCAILCLILRICCWQMGTRGGMTGYPSFSLAIRHQARNTQMPNNLYPICDLLRIFCAFRVTSFANQLFLALHKSALRLGFPASSLCPHGLVSQSEYPGVYCCSRVCRGTM